MGTVCDVTQPRRSHQLCSPRVASGTEQLLIFMIWWTLLSVLLKFMTQRLRSSLIASTSSLPFSRLVQMEWPSQPTQPAPLILGDLLKSWLNARLRLISFHGMHTPQTQGFTQQSQHRLGNILTQLVSTMSRCTVQNGSLAYYAQSKIPPEVLQP